LIAVEKEELGEKDKCPVCGKDLNKWGGEKNE
jgi:DNA repair exonuclease SbcCD ATPase subunit